VVASSYQDLTVVAWWFLTMSIIWCCGPSANLVYVWLNLIVIIYAFVIIILCTLLLYFYMIYVLWRFDAAAALLLPKQININMWISTKCPLYLSVCLPAINIKHLDADESKALLIQKRTKKHAPTHRHLHAQWKFQFILSEKPKQRQAKYPNSKFK